MTDPALHLAAARDSLTLAEQGVIEQAALVADLRAEVAGLFADKAALLARVAELEALLPKPATRFGYNYAKGATAPAPRPVEVARIYFDHDDFATSQPTWNLPRIQQAVTAGATTFVVSLKEHGPVAKINRFLDTVPEGVDVYGCYFHEHEGNLRDGEFTVQQYRDRFAQVRDLFQARGHKFGPIHNGLNLRNGKWVWGEYVEPDLSRCDYWGLDCYDPNSKGVDALFGQWLPYAQSTGLPIVIGETGHPASAAQAGWAATMRQWCLDNGVAVACWWTQQFAGKPDYRLTDAAAKAWLDV